MRNERPHPIRAGYIPLGRSSKTAKRLARIVCRKLRRKLSAAARRDLEVAFDRALFPLMDGFLAAYNSGSPWKVRERAYGEEWWEAAMEKALALLEIGQVWCWRCEKIKPAGDFPRTARTGRANGAASQCVACWQDQAGAELAKDCAGRSRKALDWMDRRLREEVKGRRYSSHMKRRRLEARREYARALKEGRLVRGPCEVCGHADTDGHHPDLVGNPLQVRWLCPTHHRAEHRRLFRGEEPDGKETVRGALPEEKPETPAFRGSLLDVNQLKWVGAVPPSGSV